MKFSMRDGPSWLTSDYRKKDKKIFLIVYFTIHILFQRDKSRWMSSSNTGTTVLYWFVRDGKFSQIMSDHLRLQDNTKPKFSTSFLLLDTKVLFSNTHTLLVSDLYWLNKQCLSAFVDKLGKKIVITKGNIEHFHFMSNSKPKCVTPWFLLGWKFFRCRLQRWIQSSPEQWSYRASVSLPPV